jgi:hypothetical protein
LKELKNYSKRSLESLKPFTIEGDKMVLYHGIFEDLMDSEIRAFADKKIANGKAVVIIANAHNDENTKNSPEFNSTATITMAANQSLHDIDCNKIIREIAGKGGGKSHFAIGVIKKNEVSSIVRRIIATLEKI